MKKWQLIQRQSHPLKIKEQLSKQKIRKWYEHWHGEVYVSFSGGKDSTVLLNMVREEYPKVPALFVDTGLEYPEIREFVKNISNVIWMKPKIPFTKVLKKYGYPIIGKTQARYIRDLQNASSKNKATVNLRLTGFNRAGVYCSSMKLSKKWLFLKDAPFKISEQCCDVMKKEPFHRYVKETGKHPMTAVMACESGRREQQYLKQGCNAFNLKEPISMPIAFWREQDIWEYLNTHNVSYSKIYDMGEKRTGCMFCMFGVHLEKGSNRFQRMHKSHPKQWKYCIKNLGLKKILDHINVPYKPENTLFED